MYRITTALSVGRHPAPEWAAHLRRAGVTHVLNVSESPSKLTAGPGAFREVVWLPLDAERRLPPAAAVGVLDALHRLACEPGAHVYVHCVAGQLRSPTVLWLYLVACGFDAASARVVIEERSPDATPGAPRLLGPDLVRHVQLHGLAHYFPHPRGEVLVPAPLPPEPEA